MYVLYAYADTAQEWNCSQWRSLSPSNALNASGKHTARCIYLHSIEAFLDPAVQEIVGPADVIIVQRNLIKQSVWDFCDYWSGLGKTLVADLDDAYQMMPWANPAHAYWEENRGGLPKHPVDQLREGLMHVDGLTAPSRQLLEDWEDVVAGYWLPNWATGSWYKSFPDRELSAEREALTIGWGGSVSHYDSWWGSGIRDALVQLCVEFPHVRVKVCGNDKRIFDQLLVPDAQKIHQVGVPPEQWPGIVNTFDIGVAPLSGEYDQRRSWIKALEYLLVGIPWVGTSGRPYTDFAEYGQLVNGEPEQWYIALREIVENYDEHLAVAQANREVGFANTLEVKIDEYSAILRRITGARRNVRLPGIAYYNWEVPDAERDPEGTESSNEHPQQVVCRTESGV